MKAVSEEDFIISERGIDAVSAFLREKLGGAGVSEEETIRLRVSFEEAMLNWLHRGFRGAAARVRIRRHLRGYCVTLSVKGARCDPLAAGEGESEGLQSILRMYAHGLDFRYSRGENRVTATAAAKPRLGPFALMLCSIAAGLIFGVAVKALAPAAAPQLSAHIIAPLYSAFINVLNLFMPPLVFFSILCGILNIGDIKELQNAGGKIILKFAQGLFSVLFIAAALSAAFFFTGRAARGDILSKFAEIASLFGSVIPTNFVKPFLDGNTLQVAVLGTVIGCAALFFKDGCACLLAPINAVNALLCGILSAICSALPIFIFVGMARIALSGSIAELANIALLVGYFALLAALCAAVFTFVIFSAFGGGAKTVLRKIAPSLLIALMTASSAAAYPENVRACRDKLGADPALVSFGLPLAMVLYKAGTALKIFAALTLCSHMYGVPVSFVALLTILLMSFVYSIACPPTPGGALALYSVAFAELGIPHAALVTAMTADIFMSFIAPPLNVMGGQAALLAYAKSRGLIEGEKLQD